MVVCLLRLHSIESENLRTQQRAPRPRPIDTRSPSHSIELSKTSYNTIIVVFCTLLSFAPTSFPNREFVFKHFSFNPLLFLFLFVYCCCCSSVCAGYTCVMYLCVPLPLETRSQESW